MRGAGGGGWIRATCVKSAGGRDPEGKKVLKRDDARAVKA